MMVNELELELDFLLKKAEIDEEPGEYQLQVERLILKIDELIKQIKDADFEDPLGVHSDVLYSAIHFLKDFKKKLQMPPTYSFSKKESKLCLSTRDLFKWEKGDVVELIQDPGRGPGIITGVTKKVRKRIFYQVAFWWSNEELEKRKFYFLQYYEGEQLEMVMKELGPKYRYVPEGQLQDSTQPVSTSLVEKFSK